VLTWKVLSARIERELGCLELAGKDRFYLWCKASCPNRADKVIRDELCEDREVSEHLGRPPVAHFLEWSELTSAMFARGKCRTAGIRQLAYSRRYTECFVGNNCWRWGGDSCGRGLYSVGDQEVGVKNA